MWLWLMKMKVIYIVADLENDVEESIGDSFVIVWQLGISLTSVFSQLFYRLELFDHSLE